MVDLRTRENTEDSNSGRTPAEVRKAYESWEMTLDDVQLEDGEIEVRCRAA